MPTTIPVLFSLLVPWVCLGQSLADAELLFQGGNSLYQDKQYQAAAEKYEQVLDAGFESGALYYYLGNAYFRLDEVGRAILNYERAKRLLPEDEAVEFNLQLVNLKAVDRIVAPPQFFLFRYVETFKNWLGINQLSWLVLGVYLLIMALLITRVVGRNRKIRVVTGVGIAVLIVPLVLFSLTLAVRAHEVENNIEAIVMVDKVSVMSEPSDNATEQFFLHEGAKVRVEDTSGDWLRIRLADGKVGWMSKDTIEKI